MHYGRGSVAIQTWKKHRTNLWRQLKEQTKILVFYNSCQLICSIGLFIGTMNMLDYFENIVDKAPQIIELLFEGIACVVPRMWRIYCDFL